jgi:hypothetical protein
MKEFNLGTKVVVSDPCYDIPTWCQAILTGVLPGKYLADVVKSDGSDGWGIRVASLNATHEDFFDKMGLIHWDVSPADIGVDSGQCGIFNFDQFRNDIASDAYGLPLVFGGRKDSDGDLWYERMCSLTLSTEDGGVSDDDWGGTPDGVVSSSGYGDGSYTLMIGKIENDIVAFEIVYIGSDMDEEDEMDEDEIRSLTDDLN